VLSGVSLIANTNHAASGRLGYILSRAPGQGFPSGSNELVRVRFRLANTVTNTPVVFSSSPVVQETVDALANPVCTEYRDGELTSSPLYKPVIVSQPASQTVYSGTHVTLSVSVTGSPPFAYEWRLGNAVLAGATNSDLVLSNVTTSQSGSYQVIVSNAGGSVTSTPPCWWSTRRRLRRWW